MLGDPPDLLWTNHRRHGGALSVDSMIVKASTLVTPLLLRIAFHNPVPSPAVASGPA
jgi:hypothetical protein